MVDKEALTIGDVYFRLTYFDRELRRPEIVSLVYIGDTLEEDEGGQDDDALFFQDTGSYHEHGPALSKEFRKKCQVHRMNPDTLDCIFTWRGLIQELTENLNAQRRGVTFD